MTYSRFLKLLRFLDLTPYDTHLSLQDYNFKAKDIRNLKIMLQGHKSKNLTYLDFGTYHRIKTEDISDLMDAIEVLVILLPKLKTVVLFNYELSAWAVHCALMQRPALSDITFKVSIEDVMN